MTILKEFLSKIYENLETLQEKEAIYGGSRSAPLDLRNQINYHQEAIELIQQALSVQLTETELEGLKTTLKPLTLFNDIYKVYLDQLKPEIPPLPFEPETISIPPGAFVMGSELGDNVPAEETPQHEFNLPAYEIGKFSVTNEQYAEFVKQTSTSISQKAGWLLARVGKTPPQGKLNHPVVGISWDEALAYCRWLSQQTGRQYRLPTEAEWEKAARGTDDNRLYPWGNEWDPQRCHCRGQDTKPVDEFKPQSPYQCYDMVGNVWEWTSTIWGNDRAKPDYTYPYQRDGRDSLEASQQLYREYRVCRGGSYRDQPSRLRCSVRARYAADSQNGRRGFRVVKELEE
jgi:formylglycine-generating enzyme required for sulfatase activity